MSGSERARSTVLARVGLSVGVVALLFLVGGRGLEACGPWFPNRLLVEGDGFVRGAPVASFPAEIAHSTAGLKSAYRALPPSPNEYGEADADSYAKQTALVDAAELAKVMRAAGPLTPEQQTALRDYRAARLALVAAETPDDWDKAAASLPAIPAALPGEFADYFRGALLYDQAKVKEARQEWLHLLDRPAGERHYRSTWAAYMIGRTLQEESPTEAAPWFHRVRELVHDGYADSLGLAAASLGWEAQTEFGLKHYDRAFDLYTQQAAAGDPTAVSSLREVAGKALAEDDATLRGLARNAAARAAITAYITSLGGPFRPAPRPEVSKRWVTALAQAHVTSAENADRLAWAAYQAGEMDLAQRWLKLARRDSGIARWLQAKLLIRAGKKGEAERLLASLSAGFSGRQLTLGGKWGYNRVGQGPRWILSVETIGEATRGDLGVVRFAQGQYVPALDTFLRGGFWEDAAYIGERVLTVEELRRYVDRNWPAGHVVKAATPAETMEEWQTGAPIGPNLRYLLARRLAREGRYREARAYYPAERRVQLEAFTQNLVAGGTRAHRAETLWAAARIARKYGLELFGTELSPDWAVYGGSYGDDMRDSPSKLRHAGAMKTAPYTAAERQRVARSAPAPYHRYHYRYTAADLAWRAAALMPDQSEHTAQVLATAGAWLKNRDPKAADRFYKALVRRCGRTPLGQAADKLRWFPPEEETQQ
jgi:hypothetical protein